MSQAAVAAATGLSIPTIKRAESERDVSVSGGAAEAIQRALEAAGVIFVDENGEGPGVRLKKQAPAIDEGKPVEDLNASNDD